MIGLSFDIHEKENHNNLHNDNQWDTNSEIVFLCFMSKSIHSNNRTY